MTTKEWPNLKDWTRAKKCELIVTMLTWIYKQQRRKKEIETDARWCIWLLAKQMITGNMIILS